MKEENFNSIDEGLKSLAIDPAILEKELAAELQGDPLDEFDLKSFETLSFEHFFLQPMDSEDKINNTENAIKFCLKNPKWKLSIQQHKILGID